jgi:hypothetical protein
VSQAFSGVNNELAELALCLFYGMSIPEAQQAGLKVTCAFLEALPLLRLFDQLDAPVPPKVGTH